MKTFYTLILTSVPLAFLFMSFCPALKKVQNYTSLDSVQIRSQNVRVLFWNVENLYDPFDDTTKIDEEFTGNGVKRWNYSKFRVKLNRLSKTILAAGAWEPPDLVGLCEIENLYVLKKLVYETPLKSFNYGIIHHDSPDLRGVDVALLYRKARFTVLGSRSLRIRFPFDTLSQTREILAVKGLLLGKDTLHVFVNHWPSRRGGEEVSRPRRNWVAGILRSQTDSILSRDSVASILIMGDFNDEPFDESLRQTLGAGDPENPGKSKLVNLMLPLAGKDGTHKFQGHWGLLDQFVVSARMVSGKGRIKTSAGRVKIFRPDFLLENDYRYFGDKPMRTYSGPRYLGGFSDHLPVLLTLSIIH